MKTWEIGIETPKFKKKIKTNDSKYHRRYLMKVKRLYGADEAYHDGYNVVLHYKKVVGKWSCKRLDGVKV